MLQRGRRQPGVGAQRRQPERLVERVGLGALQGQLQRGPLARRLRPQQELDRHAERAGEGAEQPEGGLAVPVLHLGQVGGRAADRGAELGEGQAAALPLVPDPLSDHPGVQRRLGVR